jgi:hypothetical protein
MLVGNFTRPDGYFLHLGEVLLKPVISFLYRLFLTQRELGTFAMPGATRKLWEGFLGRHYL